MKSVQWKKYFACYILETQPQNYWCIINARSHSKKERKKSPESRPEICLITRLKLKSVKGIIILHQDLSSHVHTPYWSSLGDVQIKSSSEMILLFKNKCRLIFVFVFIFALGFTFFIIKINNTSFDMMKVLSAGL